MVQVRGINVDVPEISLTYSRRKYFANKRKRNAVPHGSDFEESGNNHRRTWGYMYEDMYEGIYLDL